VDQPASFGAGDAARRSTTALAGMTKQSAVTDVDEERWCAERRAQVADYLIGEGVKHGSIGEWPAWHVAPYVSVWAIESLKSPGWVGWWVVCGDLPTDYVSSKDIRHPREAVRAIAKRWRELVPYLERGEPHPSVRLGTHETSATLAPLLKARGELLSGWADDDSIWPK
jgi:hypothetical protein